MISDKHLKAKKEDLVKIVVKVKVEEVI